VQLLGNRAKDNNTEMEEQHFISEQTSEDILAKEKRENPAQYLIDTREALTKAMKRSLQNKNPSTKKTQKFEGTKGIEDSTCSMKELVSRFPKSSGHQRNLRPRRRSSMAKVSDDSSEFNPFPHNDATKPHRFRGRYHKQ
jgi:hypothetical protein